MVYVHAVRHYLWTDDLNTSFWRQYGVEGKAKDVAEAIDSFVDSPAGLGIFAGRRPRSWA